MKARKRTRVKAEVKQRSYVPFFAAGLALLVLAAFQTYSPALHGPFVFDDFNLPYYNPLFPKEQFMSWITGVRPLLMFTFWLNYEWSGRDTFSYHVLGLIFHVANSALVYLIARRLFRWEGLEAVRAEIASAFAGTLFLMHPVQTESVAYIASRSENLSVLFFLTAFAVFIYRRSPEIGWLRSATILLLYVAAVGTKENTIILPILFIVTDIWWTREQGSFAALRLNRRLYMPLLALTPLAFILVWRVIVSAKSAGFHIAGLNHPLTYFWTECRAFLTYIALAVFPIRQTIDYDVPWARGPWEWQSLVGLTAAIALAIVAWTWRRRYPAATFGIALFLLLLAPTSSFIPLADPIAEHRMYLPMLGVALISAAILVRSLESRASVIAAAAIIVIAALASSHRNHVWGSEAALWTDAVSKAPDKQRDYSHLIHGLVREKQCNSALAFMNALDRRGKVDSTLLVHWSFALECVQDYAGAADKLKRAVQTAPSADLYLRIATLQSMLKRFDEAKQNADRAIALNANLEQAYALRGDLNLWRGDIEGASRDYTRVLQLNPGNVQAQRLIPQLLERARHSSGQSASTYVPDAARP
jgi:protein O-mannosyl-transferase